MDTKKISESEACERAIDRMLKDVPAEARLRELTLDAYQETGSKKPADGVGIRIVKQLHYAESEALAWAIESGVESCLALQKTNFNKAAEGLKLDFVKIEDVPQATIAMKL